MMILFVQIRILCCDHQAINLRSTFLIPWVATQRWVAKALLMGCERLCLKVDLAKTMFSSSVLCLLF